MHKNSRGFALVVPLILILIAVGVVGYLAYQNNLLDNPFKTTKTESQPTPITDPTADWKTYTHPEHGWSLKYPPNWYVYDKGFKYSDSDGKELWFDDYGTVLFSKNPFPEYIREGTEYPFDGMQIKFEPTKESFESMIDKRNIDGLISSTIIEIDNHKAIKREYDTRTIDRRSPDRQYRSIGYLVDYPKSSFSVLMIGFSDGKNIENEETYNQILSTFKFVEGTSIQSSCSSEFSLYQDEYISVCHPSDLSSTGFQLSTITDANDTYSNAFRSADSLTTLTISNNWVGGWGPSCINNFPVSLSGYTATRITIAPSDNCNNISQVVTLTDSDTSSAWAINLNLHQDGKTIDVDQDFVPIESSFQILQEP